MNTYRDTFDDSGAAPSRQDAEITAKAVEDMRLVPEENPELLRFLEAMDAEKPPKQNAILIPEALEEQRGYAGALYGYLRPDTGLHVVLGWDGAEPDGALGAVRIGSVDGGRLADAQPSVRVLGRRDGAEVRFFLTGGAEPVPLEKRIYTLRQTLFSRHAGLMESDWMEKKCVVIGGCGSVGSCAALQLARSGVGRFVLMDTDVMEIYNVCRHQCGLADVGRYKVDALEESIHRINPGAEVRKFYRQVQRIPASDYGDWVEREHALFFGTCDNRVGNAYLCDAAYQFGAPFLSLGFMPRAWAGEIFICLPERGDVCYRCAFHHQIQRAIAEERRNHAYLGEQDAGKVHFEPGLDVDIEYGASLADKIALDILNRSNPRYHFRLLDTLTQFTVFSGTGDRPEGERFWSQALPRPLDYRRISVRDESRRGDCEFCFRTPRRKGNGGI